MSKAATLPISRTVAAVLVLVTALLATVAVAPKAHAATETDVIVYVGELGADTYEQSLDGVLYTEDQIGFMADRILWTESEIGTMADRIVYVTEVSQDNSIEVIYLVTSLWLVGTEDGGFLYEVALTPVAALPTDW